MCVDEPVIFGPIVVEKLRDRDAKEQREAGDREVPHGIHVGELKKRQANRTCRGREKYVKS